MKQGYFLIILLLFPVLNACGETKPKSYKKSIYYVDKARFAKDRPCAEALFKCLPESTDKSWQQQKKNEENAIEFFELTPDVNARFKQVVKEWHIKYEVDPMDPYVISAKDRAFFDAVELKRYLKDREASLEKQFPGFWRDVPKPVRYRWLRRAITKATKYGYEGEMSYSRSMIELCARIGLDFDLDPKWEAITKFIALPDASSLFYTGIAVRYIDFTVFNKDIDMHGHKITGWSLQKAFRYLPRPKRPVPSLK